MATYFLFLPAHLAEMAWRFEMTADAFSRACAGNEESAAIISIPELQIVRRPAAGTVRSRHSDGPLSLMILTV
ncbi:MAG: hypothetical protein O3C17_21885 [Planctomycetota bacterium]|nr:hypothetical protein [Planctomycetota bacterium]